MIAQNESHFGMSHIAIHLSRMNVTLPQLSGLGARVFNRQRGDETRGELQRVNHFVFASFAGMGRDSVNRQRGRITGERFPIHFAGMFAVEGVGGIRAEFVQIQFINTMPDLFIRVEAHADRSMFDLRMRDHIFNKSHDDRHARFVIRAEQSCAACRHQIFSDTTQHLRIFCRINNLRWIIGQHNRFAIPIFVNDRFNIRAAKIGRSVYVRQISNRRQKFFRGRRDRRQHITVLRHTHIARAQHFQLARQHVQQVPLLLSAGRGRRIAITGRINFCVTQKTI